MAKMGRPKLFTNCLDLQFQCELYIDECEERGVPLTMSGLAVAIGMDRKSLLNYARDEDFFHTIKKYRNKVETHIEELLLSGRAPAGAIFNLKNNFEWKDKQEVDQNTTINIKRKEYKP